MKRINTESTEWREGVTELIAEVLFDLFKTQLHAIMYAQENGSLTSLIKNHYAAHYTCLPQNGKKALKQKALQVVKALQDAGVIDA